MLRLLFALMLTLSLFAEESPVVVRGQFHGKVRDQVFDQNFDVRLEPGEKNELRIEMENINLSLGVMPKWHYSAGSTPDGILINFFVKCFADEPKMRLQRTATVLLEPGAKSAVELHERDSENVFSVDFQADRENPNAPPQPTEEPKEEPK
ncbi:MAG: hypothetical protein KF760_16370 [Candidatus Eremiobacteraeota bacterium]|nr:hypothetical protein [Candidatus Eremiobacteraeota bacterium]MCW5870438.1 hypothetical protein [Candidatus Eremiobacteraeota bacterium]